MFYKKAIHRASFVKLRVLSLSIRNNVLLGNGNSILTEQQKKFCLSLHYNGVNNYIFVNDVEIYKFKVKDSKINGARLCLGNVAKDFPVDDMKKDELYGYIDDFSVDYRGVTRRGEGGRSPLPFFENWKKVP